MLASLLSQPVVFGTSLSEVLQDAGLVALLAQAWRLVECHQDGCHKLGRFRHGHLRLCHVHHPLVPADGKIQQEHIDAVAGTGGTAVHVHNHSARATRASTDGGDP